MLDRVLQPLCEAVQIAMQDARRPALHVVLHYELTVARPREVQVPIGTLSTVAAQAHRCVYINFEGKLDL
jgi:hypothetical protein